MSNKKNARKKMTVSPNTFNDDTDGISTDEVKASTPLKLEYLDDEAQTDTDEEDDAMSFMNSVEMRKRPDLQGRYRDLTVEEQAEVRDLYRAWLQKHHSLTDQQKKLYEVFDDPDWNGVFVNDEYGNPHLPITDTSARSQYQTIAGLFWDSSAESGVDCIDIVEQERLVNSNTGFNSRHHLVGWMTALSVMNEAQLASQASTELRIGVEETQFASRVANELHTLALSIKNEIDQMRVLDSHYHAILMGRRLMDIEFQNTDGEFSQLATFREKINTDANKKYILEHRKQQDELRGRMNREEQEKEDEIRRDIEEVIQHYGHLLCDALDTEQDWS